MIARKKGTIEVLEIKKENIDAIKIQCSNILGILKDEHGEIKHITFNTFSGVAHGYNGDYVNVSDNEPYPIERKYFEKNYEKVGD